MGQPPVSESIRISTDLFIHCSCLKRSLSCMSGLAWTISPTRTRRTTASRRSSTLAPWCLPSASLSLREREYDVDTLWPLQVLTALTPMLQVHLPPSPPAPSDSSFARSRSLTYRRGECCPCRRGRCSPAALLGRGGGRGRRRGSAQWKRSLDGSRFDP